ncbi:hypothetical protein R1flu_000164 [Riccia fluitans]|uniref:Uncharacterized protein n=1 Tax=Riccia fluitans TaxID=41844 RepID=A0ABD1Y0K1_9MARC
MENTLQPPDQVNLESVLELDVSITSNRSTRSCNCNWVEKSIIVMGAPVTVEQKEEWWKSFHQGKGSVIHKGPSQRGRSSMTFVTPSGEQFNSYGKAQAHVRAQRQQFPTRTIEDFQGQPLGKKRGRKCNRSKVQQHANRTPKLKHANAERKEFRDWFWKKKGEIFRSWKECVKHMGFDPDPSMTAWTRKRENDNDAVDPGVQIDLVSCLSTTNKEVPSGGQRQQQSDAAPTLDFGSLAAREGVVVINNPLDEEEPLQIHMSTLYSDVAGRFQKGDSSDSEETPGSAQSDPEQLEGFESENGRGFDFQGSEPGLLLSVSMGDKGLKHESGEEETHDHELQFANEKSFNPESFLSEQNNDNNTTDNSSPADHGEKNFDEEAPAGSGKTEVKKRRRLTVVSTRSDELEIEENDVSIINAEGGKRVGEVHSADDDEQPQVIAEAVNANVLTAAEPDDEFRMPSVVDASKEKAADYNTIPRKPRAKGIFRKKVNWDPSAGNNLKRALPFVDCNHLGPNSKTPVVEVSIISNVDDETLHRNLISLLYADYIKQQASRSTHLIKGNVIGMLYAEYIERSFVRIQKSGAPQPEPSTSRKRIRIPKGKE